MQTLKAMREAASSMFDMVTTPGVQVCEGAQIHKRPAEYISPSGIHPVGLRLGTGCYALLSGLSSFTFPESSDSDEGARKFLAFGICSCPATLSPGRTPLGWARSPPSPRTAPGMTCPGLGARSGISAYCGFSL